MYKSKIVIILLLLILLLEITLYLQKSNVIPTFNLSFSYANATNNNNTEEEYIRTIRLLLYPYLEKEVQDRYGKYAHVNSYDMDIDNISIGPDAKIIVEITFRPYIGAHNTISTDKATFQIEHNEAKIIEYITVDN